MRPSAPTSIAAIRGWRFVRDPTRPRPDEPELFARHVAELLRIGHPLEVGFELSWETGASGGFRWASSDRATEAWWRGGGMPVYPPTCWRAERRPIGPEVVRFLGTPERNDAAPFRADPATPWSDTVARTARALTPGWRVVWNVRSAGRWAEPAEPDRLERRPPGFGLAPVAPVGRTTRELSDARGRRLVEARWLVEPRVVGTGAEPAGRRWTRALEGAARQDGGNGWKFRPAVWWNRKLLRPGLLSTTEIAALFPTPWSPWAEGADPPSAAGGVRLLLGHDPSGFPVSIPIEPGNGRHLLVTGETGMGKSTWMVEAAVAASRLGTVLLLDPLGETGRQLEERLRAEGRGDVRRISPTDAIVPIDALAGARGEGPSAERAIADLVDALRRVRSSRFTGATYWGPRIEETIFWALRAASALPNGTLVDAEQFLIDPDVRLVGGLPPAAETALRALRDRARGRPEEIEGAHRVLAEASRSAALRGLLAAPGTRRTIQEFLAPGAATIVAGDAGAVGESTARTLLSLYLALIWSGVVGRNDRSPIFLFLDEASWFANDSLAQMFRLGRRWGLHVIVAAQSMAGFPEELREPLTTNASDLILFRGSPDEAREIERWGTALTTERLVALPRGWAAALLGKGRELRFLYGARPPPAPRAPRSADRPPGDAPVGAAEEAGVADAARTVSDHLAVSTTTPHEALEALRWTGLADEPIVIDLEAWRARHAFAPAVVRELGRELARAGVVRSARREGRTSWTLDRSRLAEWLAAEPSRRSDAPSAERAAAP